MDLNGKYKCYSIISLNVVVETRNTNLKSKKLFSQKNDLLPVEYRVQQVENIISCSTEG